MVSTRPTLITAVSVQARLLMLATTSGFAASPTSKALLSRMSSRATRHSVTPMTMEAPPSKYGLPSRWPK